MLLISNSEIQKFKECRRSWYVQYYLMRQPKELPVTGATNMGTKIHAALEGYYNPQVSLTASEASWALHNMYELDMREHPEAQEALLDERQLASIMITGYFEWLEETGADEGIEVVSVEREIVVPLMDGVNLRGRLDTAVRDKRAGSRMFMDHKTCIQFLAPDYLDRDEQAKFYMMLQRLDKSRPKEEWCDGGIFNMLRKCKRTAKATPPFYKREIVRHNSSSMNSMYRRTQQVVTELLGMRLDLDAGLPPEQVAYPHPGKDCSWRCPLAAGLCSMIDDGSAWIDYLEDQFVKVDPYARYTDSGYLDRLDQEGML